MGKKWKQWQTVFLGSKITAYGDCSHKIKRRLLLGRKAMTNIDSILKAETLLCQQRSVQFSSVQSLNHVWLFGTLWRTQHAKLPRLSPTPRACLNSCPLSRWCHPTISSFVVPFSSWLQSFPASGSFLMSQFFESGGQSIGASASAPVLPMNIQDWFPLELNGLISLQFKGLSRVFSNTTVQKHRFFSA